MTDTNTQVALTFMKAMGTNDAALAATCIAPDAVAIAKGHGKFAGTRDAKTMIGTIDAFKEMLPTGLRFTIVSATAGGDRVAVEAEGNGVTCEGKPYRNQYCFVFTLAEGKIRSVNEYFCTVHADEVLWPLVEAQGEKLAAR